jgi:hypothetical protein
MKINKKKTSLQRFHTLSEAKIQGLFHSAQANLGYFLAWFQSFQLPSKQPGIPHASESLVSSKVRTQLLTEVLIFHISTRISEGLL